MFNVNNPPVTTRQLESFVAAIATEVDNVHPDLDPAQGAFLLAVGDAGSILMVASPAVDPATTAHIDRLFAPRRRLAAIVSATGWAPHVDAPVSLAWVVVAVGIGGVPACVAVRRVLEDEQWTLIEPHEIPWFAASSAGALRAQLETGKPLRWKETRSPELHQRPDELPTPPVDEKGEL